MHTSTILASFFALFFTSLVSQGATTCVNVKQNDNGTASIRLRGSGQTCGKFPLIVPKTGFQFKVYIPHKSTDTNLGSLQFYFGDLAVPLSIVNDGNEFSVFTKSGTYLGEATLDVTTFDIKPDGTGFVAPRKPTASSIKIPSLEKFQRYHEDKVMIQLKIEWIDVNNDFIIELPNHFNNNASAPPMSTTSFVMSTEVVSYTEVNETTTITAFLTSPVQGTSNTTSKVSWIIIVAVVGFIFVIIVIVAVIGAVYVVRRIRRKRSATGLLQTPTTRVTYPSNEIHRFNIPIDPNSKITDHGINFNDYLAVVPAYPEEIREFENAKKKKKDEMYLGFMERIHVAERTENKGSK
uniref:Uncharacterized protein n=1 Tax=Panagrellus redivivus TaxID=6233 RepID=A0A7E4ZYG4_PANRE